MEQTGVANQIAAEVDLLNEPIVHQCLARPLKLHIVHLKATKVNCINLFPSPDALNDARYFNRRW
jgi:hypothetical protein